MSSVLLLSGGLDSTALAAAYVARHGSLALDAVGVDYGQRHARELDAAANVARALSIRFDVIDLRAVGAMLSSALTGNGPVPHGHYADDNMRATVVPNRNAILLNVAVGIAASRGHGAVLTAVHAGDHPVYPDCRPEFVAAASLAATKGTEGIGDVHITAPFVHMTKARVVATGAAVGAPFDLTWSCYEGGERHCGRCGTCVERAEAFAEAVVHDPTDYADADYWRRVTA